MPRIKNLTNKQFGQLTALSLAEKSKDNRIQWNCICSCGNKTIVRSINLTSGVTCSCGCFKMQQISKAKTSHGMTNSPTYNSWWSMKQRCTNPNAPDFKRYGGRGVTICDRWTISFSKFYEDMGIRPKGKTLDRKNNNEGYYFENCHWTTATKQANNRRNNKFITYNNTTLSYAQWSYKLGGSDSLVTKRIGRGWDEIKAVTTPI